VLSYATETTPAWNAHGVGVVVAVAAFAALVAFHQWEEWVNAALAAWLIVSPYLLGFSTGRSTGRGVEKQRNMRLAPRRGEYCERAR
jgi:hypothetical protein